MPMGLFARYCGASVGKSAAPSVVLVVEHFVKGMCPGTWPGLGTPSYNGSSDSL